MAASRFQLRRRLGAGAMGEVYEALDTERRQAVALKRLTRRDPDHIYWFKREFRALTGITSPHLAELHDLFVEDDSCFFTMELVPGVDFLTYCRADVGIPPGTAIACHERRLRAALPQLVIGLIALHRAGKVHRDIKPSNILVTEAGRVVVVDFGLVGDMHEEESLGGKPMGTPEYVSPEQAAVETRLTPASDWYSVGVVLYEALTGRLPFSGTGREILYAKLRHSPPPPRAIRPGIPPDLDELCVELLAREPERRPTGPEILSRLGADLQAVESASPRSTRTGMESRLFTGRQDELHRLDRALARVRAGTPGVVHLHGPSGIGKTELVSQFIDRAALAHPGLVALAGRCLEQESVSYRGIDSVIDALSRVWRRMPDDQAQALVPRQAAHLTRLFPVLGRVPAVAAVPRLPALADPQDLRGHAAAALREVLARLGTGHPLVLVIDDLQWADRDTLVLLGDLMRPPDPPRLLLLLVTRDRGADEARATVRRRGGLPALLDELPVTDDLEVGPLPEEDAMALAENLLGSRERARPVIREALGSPLFIVELAHYLQTAGDQAVVNLRLSELIAQRVAKLSPAASALLQAVAVAGEPINPRVAGTAARFTSTAELRAEIRSLRSAKLLRTDGAGAEEVLETHHQSIRAAVLAGMTPATRAKTHERLVLSFEHWGEANAARLARHWLGAGDQPRAAVHALEAADEATAKLDPARAATFLEMAIALGAGSGDKPPSLLTRLGEAHALAGKPREAASAFQAAARQAQPAERLELRRRAAEQLMLGGYLHEGMDALREVLDDLGLKLAPTPRRALLSLLRSRARLRLRGFSYRLRDEAQIPRQELTRWDALWSASKSLAIVDVVRAADFAARNLLMALRLGERQRMSRALSLEAAHLAAVGARKRCERLLRTAEELNGDMWLLQWGRGAYYYFMENDWRRAVAAFRDGQAGLRSAGIHAGWEMNACDIYECFSLMYLGEIDELGRRVRTLLREAQHRGDRFAAVNLRTRLALVWIARDQPERGLRQVEEGLATWLPAQSSYLVQHFYALHSRCEIDLYRGEIADAQARFGEQLPALERSLLLRVPLVAVEVHHLQARILLAGADGATAGRAATVRRLARKMAGSGLPVATGLAALVRAGAARCDGRTDEAAAELRTAIAALDPHQTGLLVAAARRRLGQTLGGSEGAALVAEADAWMTGHGVASPERLTAMLVPGWPDPH